MVRFFLSVVGFVFLVSVVRILFLVIFVRFVGLTDLCYAHVSQVWLMSEIADGHSAGSCDVETTCMLIRRCRYIFSVFCKSCVLGLGTPHASPVQVVKLCSVQFIKLCSGLALAKARKGWPEASCGVYCFRVRLAEAKSMQFPPMSYSPLCSRFAGVLYTH